MLNIDLKDILSIVELKKRIADFDLMDNVLFTGCGTKWAKEVIRELPNLPVLLNAYYEPAYTDEEPYMEYVYNLSRTAAGLGCCGINIDYNMCRPVLVDYAKKRFLPVSVWTVDDLEEMQEMVLMGVFGVTTYYPGKLLGLMTQRGN